jgi:hypothetical protein
VSAEGLVFGERCAQHAAEGIEQVTRRPVEWRGGQQWLVTARYGCGHRHTQHAPAAPLEVEDTAGRRYAVQEGTD